MKSVLKSAVCIVLVALSVILPAFTVAAQSDGWYSDSKGWYHVTHGSTDRNAFVKDSVGTCYVGNDGYVQYDKWVYTVKGWCHVNDKGYLDADTVVFDTIGACLIDINGHWITTQGWHKFNGNLWVYVGNNQRLVTNTWMKDSKGWCHLGENGVMDVDTTISDSLGLCLVDKEGRWVTAQGWIKYHGTQWIYIDQNERLAVNTWIQDSKGWCHLNESGCLDTDTIVSDSIGLCLVDRNGRWVKTQGFVKYKDDNWVYIGSNYRLAINTWVSDTQGTYHMNSDGYLDTDKILMDNKGFCLVDSKGALVTRPGWNKLQGTSWVYIDSNQHLKTNSWIYDQGRWCHVDMIGILDTDTLVLDSNGFCYVDADGYWVKDVGWYKVKGTYWVFVGANHRALADIWAQDTAGWCHLNESGYLDTDMIVKDSQGYCLVDKTGHWVNNEGWYLIQDSTWVYVGSNQRVVTNVWRRDSNGWRYLNDYGYAEMSTVVRDSVGFCYIGSDGYWVTSAGKYTVSLWDATEHAVRDYVISVETGGYLKTSTGGKDFWKE